MEYAKDVILKLTYQSNFSTKKQKMGKWISMIKQRINKNKFILSILSITIILIFFDFALVNNFIDLLTSL